MLSPRWLLFRLSLSLPQFHQALESVAYHWSHRYGVSPGRAQSDKEANRFLSSDTALVSAALLVPTKACLLTSVILASKPASGSARVVSIGRSAVFWSKPKCCVRSPPGTSFQMYVFCEDNSGCLVHLCAAGGASQHTSTGVELVFLPLVRVAAATASFTAPRDALGHEVAVPSLVATASSCGTLFRTRVMSRLSLRTRAMARFRFSSSAPTWDRRAASANDTRLAANHPPVGEGLRHVDSTGLSPNPLVAYQDHPHYQTWSSASHQTGKVIEVAGTSNYQKVILLLLFLFLFILSSLFFLFLSRSVSSLSV